MSTDNLPEIFTRRLCLRFLEPHEAPLMTRFRIENKKHLEPWEPKRTAEFFTEPFWQLQLGAAVRDFCQGHSVCLVVLDKPQREVLGVCNYTNIIRGTFQSCHLGYALSEQHQGDGLMGEALQSSIDYIFKSRGLHRIMANYLPHNQRSGKLLERLGFEVEGRAKQFLLINDRWEDHVLTSLINPCSNPSGHSS